MSRRRRRPAVRAWWPAARSRGWGRPTLCLLACLVAGCGGLAPGTPTPRTLPPSPTAEAQPGSWVVVATPGMTLAFDRARAIALVRPTGDAGTVATLREGPDPGAAAGGLLLREELREAGETFDGAPAPGTPGPRVTPVLAGDEARLIVEDIRLGDVGTARWEFVLRGGEVTIARAITLRRATDAAEAGLAMQPPEVRVGGRLLFLDGVALRASPDLAERRERLRGATVGAVDLDREGFLFTARSDEATSAATAARDGQDRLVLGNALAAASGSGIRTKTTLRFGPATHLQGPRADFGPALDARFLAAGYYGNVFASACCGPLLRASMTSYATSAWVRDLAYAAQGYRHVLEDLGPLRNTIQAFLDRVGADGTVPEFITGDGDGVRRGAWDSQPDLIHAVYAYVAQTGDVAFYSRNRAAIGRVAEWLRVSDTDGDGLPDRTDAPFGYFDSVANGVRHTYAIASFYTAYGELAELAEAGGRGAEAATYRADAARLRDAFDRPVAEGGFWLPGQPYPVAWFAADGRPVTGFETFGVLAAIRGGLIPPGARLDALAAYLQEHLAEFVDGAPFGVRLMLGGYAPELRRDVVPAVPPWMLDASAPWIAGLDVPVRARLGQREGAMTVLASYLASYDAAAVPLPEFAAGPGARHGAGQSDDAGRSWDNAAWFTIVYEGHYGLLPTPAALRIQPAPLRAIPGDTLTGYRYGKARVALTLAEDAYTVRVDQPCALILLPMGADTRVALDGGAPAPSISIQARPGQTYTIRSGETAGGASETPIARPPTATIVPTAATPQPPTATPPPPTATLEPSTATPEPLPTTDPPPPTTEPPAAAPEPPATPPVPPPPPFRATHRIGAPVPVNLRAGPGAGFAALGALPPETPLASTGESTPSGGFLWRRFRLADGRAGWVREVDVLPAP